MDKRDKKKVDGITKRLVGISNELFKIREELEDMVPEDADSENVFNDRWGSRGPDCLAMPLAAVGV